MKTASSIVGGALLLLATLRPVSAAITCDPNGPFRLPQWTCDICGDYLRGSAPWRCGPGNMTFDDLPTGPLNTTYQRTAWTGFSVVAGNTSTDGPLSQLAHLTPASAPNFARLPAGKTGILDLTARQGSETYGGTLYSLRYACTLANTNIPAACRVTFDGVCYNFNTAASDPNPFHHNSTTLTYTPVVTVPLLGSPPSGQPSLVNGTMAYARAVGPQGLYLCRNQTITAQSLLGPILPVDLYLDEVLHSAWWYLNI